MAATAPSMTVPVAKNGALPGPGGSQFVQQTSSTLPLSSMCRIGSKQPSGLASSSELRSWQKRKVCRSRCSRGLAVRAADELASVTGAGGDSVVSEVAVLEEEPQTPGVASPAAVKERKPGPLQKGGTMSGKEALGKDPSAATLGKKKGDSSQGLAFEDPRWVKGTWDFTKFTKDGKVHWDSVIDAEVKRRKWLEDNPEASSNSDPVVFETAQIPWWAWVRRFHLPEAELLNGRAAMVGYFAAYLVDSATGVGLVDQQSSFLGKLLLFITIVGILLIRKTEDLDTLKTLAKESTFYDKQWQATWKEDTTKEENPSE